jgi:hypothetical protein
MSPGGYARVMALTPPVDSRFKRKPTASVNTTKDKNGNKRPARAGRGVQLTAMLRIAVGYGAGRDRTGDLRLAKAALSQLSYSPEGGGPKWI